MFVPHPLTCVVVADGTRARFFRHRGPDRTLSPALEADLVSEPLTERGEFDAPLGRGHQSSSSGRYAMEPHSDPRRVAKAEFAHRVADVLNQRAQAGDMERIVIVAPPRVLGDIRPALSAKARAMVHAEIDRELTKVPVHELEERLAETLA